MPLLYLLALVVFLSYESLISLPEVVSLALGDAFGSLRLH